MSRRINLEIQIRECTLRQYAKGQKKLTLHYRANNKSNLPITITDLQSLLTVEFMMKASTPLKYSLINIQ